MSQAQQQQQQQQEPDAGGEKPQTQPSNVRVVPIFVEGRDEPVINKDHGDTSGGQVPPTQHHHHQQQPHANHYHEHMNPRTGRDRASDIDFAFNNGTDIPSFAQGASISDWAKSMPVRSNMKDRFRDFFGDERDSPIRNIPVNHMHGEPRVHNIRRQASPQPQQERKRTSSGSSAPTPPPQQQQQQQQQQAPPQKPEAKTKLPTAPPTNNNNNNKKDSTPPPSQQPQAPPTQVPPKPVPVDAITKIQQIQKDVLDLMGKVEKFEGKTKKDKEYLYLDEMLTQNLLKLDTVDTDGKENVKLARKEAVKCINRCLNVLEAKAEASEVATKAGSPQPSSSPQPESQKQAAAAGNEEQTEPSKTPSQSSVYDNNQQEAAVVSESPAGETSTTSQ